jgi:hypothetical protein
MSKLAKITCPPKSVREFVDEMLTMDELQTARRIVVLTQDDTGGWRISYHNVDAGDLALVALLVEGRALEIAKLD